MNYNDYELVSIAQEGNIEYKNIIYEKYLPIINKKIGNIYKYVKGKGLELEDIKQECLLALEKSINSFNQNKDGNFYTFVNICLDRALTTFIRDINRNKYKILNESIPIETIDEELDLLDILSYEELNPENIYLDYNDYLNIYENIINKLTNFEECVFVLKIKGFSSNDISILLDKNEKSINNAICRIKLKVKDLYV